MKNNDLAGGRLPSGKFGVNAAWWRIMILALNPTAALKRLALPAAAAKGVAKEPKSSVGRSGGGLWGGRPLDPPPLTVLNLFDVPRKSEDHFILLQLSVKTSASQELVNITSRVEDAVAESGVREGVCTLYCPHTTAGLTINEAADPDVARDIVDALERAVPSGGAYRHREGNAHSHVKASLMGPSQSVFVEGGRLRLGAWQGIFLCEFDGPRSRSVLVRVTEG